MFNWDDISFGGGVIDVLHDLAVIEREAAELCLLLNHRKSEVICSECPRGIPFCPLFLQPM